MTTKTYVPAIMRKYEEAGKIINYLTNVHRQDEQRIKKVVAIDIHQADELDRLENGFVYGGNK